MENIIKNELDAILQQMDLDHTSKKFRDRLDEGSLTRSENSQSHFCVCLLLIDLNIQKVFLSHHKKSNFWLCFGGHLEFGENIKSAANRELKEEIGLRSCNLRLTDPEYLSTTLIENPKKDSCRLHFDVWHFIRTSIADFPADPMFVQDEFYRQNWFSIKEARQLPTSKSMLKAIDFVEFNIFNQNVQ